VSSNKKYRIKEKSEVVKCDQCEKTFASTLGMQMHALVKHSGVQAKPESDSHSAKPKEEPARKIVQEYRPKEPQP